MNILYITVHMGGGAGKAISGIARCCVDKIQGKQTILLLENPEKDSYIKECQKTDISVVVVNKEQERIEYIKESDIIVLNWWQHPKMAEFLANFPSIPCRMILWLHVNGCMYPYLPYSLTEIADEVLFTTRYSLENPIWSKKQRMSIKKKSAVVSGMGEFKPENIPRKKDYKRKEGFVIGYIGTINYGKIHPQFLIYCKTVLERIPNTIFLMIGDYEGIFTKELQDMGIADSFIFTGYVENVFEYMEKIDILSYLLSPENYATTENILLEAMAFGMPIVVCKNKPEEFIIQNKKNGYLVNSREEYADIIQMLADSEECREKIGAEARKTVIREYSSTKNCQIFLQAIEKIKTKEKTIKNFTEVYGKTPYEWFLAGTGSDRELFSEYLLKCSEEEKIQFFQRCKPIYREKTKSSITHFASYFPYDKKLKMLEHFAGNNFTPGGIRTPLAEALPLKVPYLVQVFPIYACNFRCEYCLHALKIEERGFISERKIMELSLFQKMIDDMKRAKWRIKMLRFAAIGEPLLHPELSEMIAYAKKADIAESIDVVTNASLLTRELSNALLESGLSRLRISIEGLSDKEYEQHTGIKIDFFKMVENIRYFYEHSKNTTVYIKIIDYMIKEEQQKQKFYQIFLPICHSIAIEHLTPTIKGINYEKMAGGMPINKPQNGESLINALICPQPFYMMQINPDGKVVPCCSMKFPRILGDITERAVSDVWNGELFENFRRTMLDGVQKAEGICRECNLYQYDLHSEDKLDDMAEKLKEKYKGEQYGTDKT